MTDADTGWALFEQYEQSGRVELLRDSIAAYRRALARLPGEDAERAVPLLNLAIALRKLFEHTESLATLREAVSISRQAMAATPVDDPARATCVSQFGSTLLEQHRCVPDRKVLERAIRFLREAVETTPIDLPERPLRLINLGHALVMLFQDNATDAALQEAVSVLRAAAAAIPPDDPLRARTAGDLCEALRLLFGQTGDPAVLQEAVRYGREAAMGTPPGHPAQVSQLSNLGLALTRSFELSGVRAELEEAVDTFRRELASMPAGHPERPTGLSNLSEGLSTLFEQTGDLATLREVVALRRAAVSADRRPRLDLAASLASALAVLFRQTGDSAALAEAVALGRAALADLPQDHPQRSTCLSLLAGVLRTSAERSGDLKVLREAVALDRESLANTRPGSPNRAGALAAISSGLRMLSEQTGDSAVLTDAVAFQREAVAATPTGHLHRGTYLGNLSNVLRITFQHTGDLTLLAEAIAAAQEAVAATPTKPPGHPYRAARLSNLGASLLLAFLRTRDPTMLARAINAYRGALASTTVENDHYPTYLSDLGAVLYHDFERTKDPATLAESVNIFRAAHADAPPDHPSQAMYMSNLSFALRRQFDHTGDLATIEEAVQAARQAVSASPEHHQHQGLFRFNLGASLAALGGRTQDPDVLAEARGCYLAVAARESAPIDARLWVMRRVAATDMRAGNYEQALGIVELAATLIPQLAARQLRRDDREHRIGHIVGLPSIAAAAALGAGDPGRAVELLEQTRGVLLTDTIDLRSDLTELRRHAPELAAEFDRLRTESEDLDTHPTGMLLADAETAVRRNLAQRRSDLSLRWPSLLDRIRQLPGFAGFLRPPPIDQLRRQASDGPIVYVTAFGAAAHALVVVNDPDRPVRPVPLPELTEDAVVEQANLLYAARHVAMDDQHDAVNRRNAQHRIHGVLQWIWDTIANPVLRELGHLSQPDSDQTWPRIWWCPVGSLATLPLHAAGYHREPGRRTVLDRVISSYTPTIRALAHARTTRPSSLAPASLLVVSVPDAPGARPLPGVERELCALRRLVPGATVLGPDPTPTTHAAVTAALPRHRIAHFAGHGVTDWSAPARSHLLLPDKPLTVADISQLQLGHAELAYLSACSTTDTAPDHHDEATHITAACQLAGYRNVIGTLWAINDHAATMIAEEVYTRLSQNGTATPDPALSAMALHHAVRTCRGRYLTLPTRWAAHLHTGG